MFYYSRDRGGAHPQAHLAGYGGILQADAYGGYGKLYEAGRHPGPILEAACWVHARRPFFVMADLEENARRKAASKKEVVVSPMAMEIVRRIDALFEIERTLNGKSADQRKATRQALSALLVADLKAYMIEQRAKLSRGHDLAKAMDYILKRWAAFTLFLDDGPCLPLEQRRREGAKGDRPGPKVLAVLRLRPRWPPRRRHVQPDRDRQDE
jgi:transposase